MSSFSPYAQQLSPYASPLAEMASQSFPTKASLSGYTHPLSVEHHLRRLDELDAELIEIDRQIGWIDD